MWQNVGTNFIAYLPLLFVGVLAVIGYFIVKAGWELSKIQDVEDKRHKELKKIFIRRLITMSVVFVFLLFSLFFAYGSGKRLKTTDYQKSGWMERVKDLPDEKPIAVITQEGEANKDKTGTLPKVASEEEYQKSKEEADKAIEEMLKRNQNN